MGNYILEKFEELSEDYLDNNCRTFGEYERYGDNSCCKGGF